jgi:hypothetical protein
LQRAHDGPRRLSRVTGIQLPFELVQRGKPITLDLVTEDVHETCEAVHRAKVRPQAPREQQRGDGEVLRPRTPGNRGDVHLLMFASEAGQVV